MSKSNREDCAKPQLRDLFFQNPRLRTKPGRWWKDYWSKIENEAGNCVKADVSSAADNESS
jgi:hypothetical protein